MLYAKMKIILLENMEFAKVLQMLLEVWTNSAWYTIPQNQKEKN